MCVDLPDFPIQYMDCLLTMFNILLIIAGILEYILLGIDFKVYPAVPQGKFRV